MSRSQDFSLFLFSWRNCSGFGDCWFKPGTKLNRQTYFSLMNFSLLWFPPLFFLNCRGTHFSIHPTFDLHLYSFVFGHLREGRWEYLSSNWSQPYSLHTPRSLSQWRCQVKSWEKAGSLVDSWDSSCDFSLHLIGFHIPVHLGKYFSDSGNSASVSVCRGFSIWGLQKKLQSLWKVMILNGQRKKHLRFEWVFLSYIPGLCVCVCI